MSDNISALVIFTAAIHQAACNFMVTGHGNGFSQGYMPLSLQEAASRHVRTRRFELSAILKSDCICAEYMNRNYGNKFQVMGRNLILVLSRAYDRALKQYDVLVMPTLCRKAPKLPRAGATLKEQFEAMSGEMKNTAPFDGTGHPAISINAGFSERLPVGMQIVGRHFDETTVLQVARAYEKIRDGK